MFVDLCLVNVYRRRKLEGARVVVSGRMAANRVAVRCGRAIARVSVACRAVAYANAHVATARFNRLIGACSAELRKKQMITRPGTLGLAKYVIVFTTRSTGSTADVLRSYCTRWQIELVFKRLKSLAQLGHLPSMTRCV